MSVQVLGVIPAKAGIQTVLRAANLMMALGSRLACREIDLAGVAWFSSQSHRQLLTEYEPSLNQIQINLFGIFNMYN